MSSKFLTIKEASDLSGRAEITIRRMVKYLITQKDKLTTQETTRKHNLSSQMISQMIRQERQNDNPQSPFIYKISLDLIKQVFSLTTQPPTQTITQDKADAYSNDKGGANQMSSQTSSQDKAFGEIVELLKEQIKTKDEQIKDLGNKIDQLIERDRETNILIGRLQERVFQLEAPKEDVVLNDVKNITETKPEGKESNLAGIPPQLKAI